MMKNKKSWQSEDEMQAVMALKFGDWFWEVRGEGECYSELLILQNLYNDSDKDPRCHKQQTQPPWG